MILTIIMSLFPDLLTYKSRNWEKKGKKKEKKITIECDQAPAAERVNNKRCSPAECAMWCYFCMD